MQVSEKLLRFMDFPENILDLSDEHRTAIISKDPRHSIRWYRRDMTYTIEEICQQPKNAFKTAVGKQFSFSVSK